MAICIASSYGRVIIRVFASSYGMQAENSLVFVSRWQFLQAEGSYMRQESYCKQRIVTTGRGPSLQAAQVELRQLLEEDGSYDEGNYYKGIDSFDKLRKLFQVQGGYHKNM